VAHLRAQLHAEDGVRFVGAAEDAFTDGEPIREPWVGFVHQVPLNDTRFLPDLHRLIHLRPWTESLAHCRGLWTMSEYARRYLRAWNVGVPVGRIPYACPPPSLRFDMDRLRDARPRRLVLAGHHLRRYRDFYDLEVPGYERIALAPARMPPELERLAARGGVRIVPRVSDDEYDRLLATSVLFLQLADASAVSTLVECIVRGTPILVNPLPAVVEYLGEGYPLYYEDPTDAARKLRDDGLLEESSRYLRGLPLQAALTLDGFVDNVAASAVYRALPTPPGRGRPVASYDLTVLVCAHSRPAELRGLIDRLAKQDIEGRFEVLLWNNNAAARGLVDAVADEARGRLDLKVIHSSENYFCMARFAAAGLMRSDRLMLCDDDVLPEPGYLRRFVEAYERHGPDVVVCATGHTFLPHALDEERPERFWLDARLRVSHREWHEDAWVHFLHANSCLIPGHVLRRALRFPLPDPGFALVDDYWLSFVLGKHLGVPVRKIRADDVMSFAESAEDPAVAMWHNPEVAEQRVRFYIYHMRRGWPDPATPPGPSPGRPGGPASASTDAADAPSA
jgi:hypothetical protein